MRNARTIMFFALIGICAKYSQANIGLNDQDRFIQKTSADFFRARHALQLLHGESTAINTKEIDDQAIFDRDHRNVLNIGVLISDSALLLVNEKQEQERVYQASLVKSSLEKSTELFYLASPLVPEITTGSYSLRLIQNSIFGTAVDGFSAVQITFEDEEYLLPQKEELMVHFRKAGIINMQYRILLKSGRILQGKSALMVEVAGKAPCVPIVNYTYTNQWLDPRQISIDSKIELGIYYSNCGKNTVTKPIILVEGFDPRDESRKIGDLYDLLNQAPYHFADDLRAQGYDLLVINFPFDQPNGYDYGAGFIERNSYAIEKFITQTLPQLTKKPYSEIVMIGPSMGGLISRMALQNLEAQNINHGVKLWLSFDSPHQGANIPISVQEFLYSYGVNYGNYEALQGWYQVNSFASRQMLIHHHNANSILIKPDVYGQAFFQKLHGSFPRNCRSISLINGRADAVETNLPTKIMNYQMNSSVGRLTEADLYSSPKLQRKEIYRMQFMGIPSSVQAIGATAQGTITAGGSLDKSAGGTFHSLKAIGQFWNGTSFQDKAGFSVYAGPHCFIPSVSALDIQYDNGQSLDLSFPILSKNIVCNNRTPFNAYFAAQQNEAHVSLSASSIAWVKNELANALRMGDAGSLGIIRQAQVFNYGSNTKTYISRDLSIEGQGILGINMNLSTDLGNGSTPIAGSEFAVETYATCTEGVKIQIQSHGKLQLGDQNGNSGTLVIKSGDVIELNSRGSITLYASSKLIIEKGGTLIIHPGSAVYLVDHESKLEIQGKLIVKENASFEIAGEGRWILHSKDIIAEKNTSIRLQNQFGSHIIWEIVGSGIHTLPTDLAAYLQGIKIQLDDPSTQLNFQSTLTLENCFIEGGSGIIVNGQPGVIIDQNSFSNGRIGITALQNLQERYGSSGRSLALRNCSFDQLETAIIVVGQGIEIDNAIANHVTIFLDAQGMEKTSTIRNSTAISNNPIVGKAGIHYRGTKTANLTIDNCIFKNFNIGIQHEQSNLWLKCSEIEAVQYATYSKSFAALNLSTDLLKDAGNNSLSVSGGVNNSTCFLEDASAIYVARGLNDFHLHGGNNPYFMLGTMNPLPSTLSAELNNWELLGNMVMGSIAPQVLIKKNSGPSSPFLATVNTSPQKGNNLWIDCQFGLRENEAVINSYQQYKGLDPLYNLNNAPICQTKRYGNIPIHVAMQNIFRDVYADSSAGNLLSVLNSLISIDQQNPRNTAELEYLSNLTWNNMYDLSGMLLRKLQGANAAKTNVLLDTWLAMNPNQQSSAFQEIQRTLLQTTESTRATAISRLGNVNMLIPNKSEADLRDYWLCILTIQDQMIQGNLTLKEFLDEVKNCIGSELTEDLDVEAPLGHEFTELTAGRNIYPNPASDYIRILSDPSKQEGKFELSDLTGRILFEGKLQPTDQNYLEIRLPQLYHGTYILHTLIGQNHQTYKLYIK